MLLSVKISIAIGAGMIATLPLAAAVRNVRRSAARRAGIGDNRAARV